VKRLVRFTDLRISLTAMKAGIRLEPHENPGRISVQTLYGHIRMHAGDRTFDLVKGKVLVLDHAVRMTWKPSPIAPFFSQSGKRKGFHRRAERACYKVWKCRVSHSSSI